VTFPSRGTHRTALNQAAPKPGKTPVVVEAAIEARGLHNLNKYIKEQVKNLIFGISLNSSKLEISQRYECMSTSFEYLIPQVDMLTLSERAKLEALSHTQLLVLKSKIVTAAASKVS